MTAAAERREKPSNQAGVVGLPRLDTGQGSVTYWKAALVQQMGTGSGYGVSRKTSALKRRQLFLLSATLGQTQNAIGYMFQSLDGVLPGRIGSRPRCAIQESAMEIAPIQVRPPVLVCFGAS